MKREEELAEGKIAGGGARVRVRVAVNAPSESEPSSPFPAAAPFFLGFFLFVFLAAGAVAPRDAKKAAAASDMEKDLVAERSRKVLAEVCVCERENVNSCLEIAVHTCARRGAGLADRC